MVAASVTSAVSLQINTFGWTALVPKNYTNKKHPLPSLPLPSQSICGCTTLLRLLSQGTTHSQTRC